MPEELGFDLDDDRARTTRAVAGHLDARLLFDLAQGDYMVAPIGRLRSVGGRRLRLCLRGLGLRLRRRRLIGLDFGDGVGPAAETGDQGIARYQRKSACAKSKHGKAWPQQLRA